MRRCSPRLGEKRTYVHCMLHMKGAEIRNAKALAKRLLFLQIALRDTGDGKQ